MVAEKNHLNWERGDAIRNAQAVEEIIDTPGFAALVASARLKAEQTVRFLEEKSPSDNPADYAKALGESRGLRLIESLARGVIENGEKELQRANAEEALTHG